LIGAVLKEGEVHKPTGGLRINQGDIVAIFSLSKDVPAVELLLQVSIEFF
jgi:trk system potassium uptake protein TrkA